MAKGLFDCTGKVTVVTGGVDRNPLTDPSHPAFRPAIRIP